MTVALVTTGFGQTKGSGRSKVATKPSAAPRTSASGEIPISGPIRTAFRQDTDAYFLVSTTRRIAAPSPVLAAALDPYGFSGGTAISRVRRRGIVWKASKQGYQAVPGAVPVLARLNVFTQTFGDATQSVTGTLVRTDGTLVDQSISNYSVQSGYETIPFPWQNGNGTTTWVPYDRAIYEERTSISNTSGTPIVPTMPFPLPAEFDGDTRFSVLLDSPDDDDGVQAIFRVKRLYKVGSDKFAEGRLDAANDIGPTVTGSLVVNLSTGTLHRLDATLGYKDGVYSQGDFKSPGRGRWEFRIQASRVTASQYAAAAQTEFDRVGGTTSSSRPFDYDLVLSRIRQDGRFTVQGAPAAVSLRADGSLTFGSSEGKWSLVGRDVQIQMGRADQPLRMRFDLGKRLLVSDQSAEATMATLHAAPKKNADLDAHPIETIGIGGLSVTAWVRTDRESHPKIVQGTFGPRECLLVDLGAEGPIRPGGVPGIGYVVVGATGTVLGIYHPTLSRDDTPSLSAPVGRFVLFFDATWLDSLKLNPGNTIALPGRNVQPKVTPRDRDTMTAIELQRSAWGGSVSHLKPGAKPPKSRDEAIRNMTTENYRLEFHADGSLAGKIGSDEEIRGTWKVEDGVIVLELTQGLKGTVHPKMVDNGYAASFALRIDGGTCTFTPQYPIDYGWQRYVPKEKPEG